MKKKFPPNQPRIDFSYHKMSGTSICSLICCDKFSSKSIDLMKCLPGRIACATWWLRDRFTYNHISLHHSYSLEKVLVVVEFLEKLKHIEYLSSHCLLNLLIILNNNQKHKLLHLDVIRISHIISLGKKKWKLRYSRLTK